MTPARIPFSLRLYRSLTRLSAPFLGFLLKRRLAESKEDPARWREKRGEPGIARPAGFLVWVHAVSVGEAISVLPVIDALLARDATLSVLLTTSTLTSARLMDDRLAKSRALHQFAPLDHPDWVRRFLDHWRPDLGLFTESEFWPNLLLGAEAQAVPLILLNARISEQTAQSWLRHPAFIGRLLRAFRLCLAQDEDTAARLYALGASRVETLGNLKFAAPPLPDKPAIRAELVALMADRPRWLAASTHPGEEEQIAETHRRLRRHVPDILTLIVPRHPERGAAIAAGLAARGLKVARRSANEPPEPGTNVYLADTLGELGIFYRLAPIVFVGGTLVPVGGQNPLEPARLGCAILHGPYTDNFAQIYARLDSSGASQTVTTSQALSLAVLDLLSDEELRAERARDAARISSADADTLSRILAHLSDFLPAPEGAADART